MQKNNNHLSRVEEEIKKEVSSIIMNDIKDPHLTGLISVTKAKVTPDLKYAKVYISILNAKNTKQDLAILKKSAGLTRSLLAKRINLRITPEIIFELDDSMEYGARIDSILKDIMKDMEKNGKDCRVVKIEVTDEKGVFKIWFKDGVNVDAETLEYEFSQWIEGDKNVVKKNEATGDILVILNPETSNNLKNSQE